MVEQTAERAEMVAGVSEHTNHYICTRSSQCSAIRERDQPAAVSSISGGLRAALPPEARAVRILMRLLGAHERRPRSRCAHAADPADPDGSIILYAFVADVERRRLGSARARRAAERSEEIDPALARAHDAAASGPSRRRATRSARRHAGAGRCA